MCKNGGKCYPIYENNDYRCKCPADYTGRHCEGKQYVNCDFLEFSFLTSDRTNSSPGDISLDLLHIWVYRWVFVALDLFQTKERNLRPYSDNSCKKKTDPFSGNKRKNIMKYEHIVIIVHLFIFCLHQLFTLECTWAWLRIISSIIRDYGGK